jgi:class 3 adenylate cyclase/tetratricopeptide (TPR) repeat protein
MTDAVAATTLEPYLPRLTAAWARERPDERVRELDATLVSVDLSGFTALSERLAAKGRAGSEELILVISGVFEVLIGITLRHGGDVLKFRGDALLLLFEGDGHAERACRASVDMQWFIENAGSTMSSVGPVSLRMSTGVHTGTVHAFLVEATHRELMVTGPATTATFRLEDASSAGEVLVSEATAAAIDPSWLGERREEGILLTLEAEKDDDTAEPPLPPAEVDLEPYVPKALRAQLAYARGEAEHRQATVAFLKYAGIDDVIEAAGSEGALEQLQQIATTVSRIADELDITWLESDIDVNAGKIYLTAGAPATSGADEERMLRALRAILDEQLPLQLRAGVNRGPIFAGDIGATTRRTYAVMGDAVNLAARLVARATPGGLLATGEVLDRSATQFETEGQPLLVKGKERAVTAYSVGRVTGVREEQAAQVLPVVGREPELTRLQEAVNAARMRQGRLVEIVGETGIGKTRLVEEVKTLAVGFNQLVATCERYATQVPFYPFREHLRPLAGIMPGLSSEEAGTHLQSFIPAAMPDLAPWLPLLAIPFDAKVEMTPETEAIDEKFRRDKLHETLEQFFMRMFLMPTLMVFEDAQWMDDASRFALQHLMANPLGKPWLVVVTRRPDGEQVAIDESGILQLGPLDEEAAAQLALSAAGDMALAPETVNAFAERSAGNPLFVRELVAAARAGADPDKLPESVEMLLTERIDALDVEDRMLLRYASVIGPSFDLELLREILGGELEDAGALERWQRLGDFVGWEGDDVLRFRQDLFRATAYEGLSFRRRRDIHRRVGEALERRAGDRADEEAGILSLHFLEAQEHERAWRYAVVAGDRARAIFANAVAAELYDRALAAADELELDPPEVAAVAEALGDVTELFAAYDRADVAYERAEGLVSDAPTAARILRKRGVLRERRGEYDEALGWYERALERLGPDGDAGQRADVELAYAGVVFRQGDFPAAIEHAKTAIELAEEAGDVRAVGHGCYLVEIALVHLGTPDPTWRERALPLLEEAGDLVGQSSLHHNWGVAVYYLGEWDEATKHYRRSGELSARAGDVVNAARASNNEAEILSDQGLLEEARALFEEAQRVWRAARYPIGAAVATSNLGRVAARARRFEDAHALLDEADSAFREIGAAAFVHENALRRAECLVLEGRYAEARALIDEALPAAREAGERQAIGSLERSLGYAIVQARQSGEAAREHLEASLAEFRELETQYEIAQTLRALADTKLAADVDAARRECEDILEQLGVVSLTTPPLP